MLQQIILASASVAKRDLLSKTGVPFTVEDSLFQERSVTSEDPRDLVKKIALGKAIKVADRHPEAIVIGADTAAVIDGEVLGKPKNEKDARNMLQRMSGRTHISLTGLAIVRRGANKEFSSVVETAVTFSPLSEEEIEAYIATKEPLGKAGSYAVQGKAALFIERIEGSYTSVAGLPLCELRKGLGRVDVDLL